MNYPQNLSVSDRRWLDIIQQCRTSGKSDHQWLLENNIKSPTFYYHVKQLRKKACVIPEPAWSSMTETQEVVPVFLTDEEPLSVDMNVPGKRQPDSTALVAVRLQVQGICMEITNSASQEIIKNTLAALQELC